MGHHELKQAHITDSHIDLITDWHSLFLLSLSLCTPLSSYIVRPPSTTVTSELEICVYSSFLVFLLLLTSLSPSLSPSLFLSLSQAGAPPGILGSMKMKIYIYIF